MGFGANDAVTNTPGGDDYLTQGDGTEAKFADPTPEEREVARRNYDRYIYLRDHGHTAFCAKADLCDRFYAGDQWSDEDLAALKEAGRPAMTINLVFSTVNAAMGEYSSKRAEFLYKPKRQATNDTAMVLTKTAMHVVDETDYDMHEKEAVADGLITSRGYLDVRIDTTENEAGEIRITSLDPRQVLLDNASSAYDPRKWADVVRVELKSIDEIEILYGEQAAARLRGCVYAGTAFDDDSIIFSEETVFGGTSPVDDTLVYDSNNGERRRVRAVRVIDRQYYKMGRFDYFVDNTSGERTPVPPDMDKNTAAQFAYQHNYSLHTRLERRVRWTTTADNVVLFDDWSPYKTMTVVPFFPHFRRGRPIGIVEGLVSPQEIHNKAVSQTLHIVNTTANSGYFVEEGSLSGMTPSQLQEAGAKTGIVIEYKPGRTPPQKILPNPIPAGLTNVAQQAAVSIREISGINGPMLGVDDTSVSGIAIERSAQRGQVQLQPVFDNLAITRRMIGRKIVELIQGFYTDERTFMIADWKNPAAEPQAMVINQPVVTDEGVKINNNVRLGDYDVAISSMPARDLYEESQFSEAVTMREAGVAIPDHHIIRYSNLYRKEEIAQEVQQMQGLAPPTEEEAQMQELMQTLQYKLLELQVEEANAKIDLITAQAALAAAKAREADQNPAIERERMQLEAGITAIEQATRERVQRSKDLNAQLQAVQSNRTKLVQERMRSMQKASSKNTPEKK